MLVLAAGPAAAQPEVAATVVGGADASGAEGQALRTRLRAAVELRPELRTLSPERGRFLFATPAEPDRAGARAAARTQLERAQDRLRNFRVDEAKDALAAATALLEPDLGLESVRELSQIRLTVAVSIAHTARDERALSKALAEYAARFGKTPPAKGQWPPDLERRLATVAARARTKLEITATPPGRAYVDGRAVGLTPLRLDKLPPGRHRVEVRADDHHPARAWVETDSAKLARADLELAPDLGRALAGVGPRGALAEPLLEDLASAARRGPAALVVLAVPAAEGRVSVRLIEVRDRPKVYGPVEAPRVADALDQAWAARAGGSASGEGPAVLPWVITAAGVGAAVAGAGIGLRLWAQDTQDPLQARRGALTQAEAFDIQGRAEDRATAGTVLIAVGAALVTGAAGLFTFDLVTGDGR